MKYCSIINTVTHKTQLVSTTLTLREFILSMKSQHCLVVQYDI